jgi:hypothetical protein
MCIRKCVYTFHMYIQSTFENLHLSPRTQPTLPSIPPSASAPLSYTYMHTYMYMHIHVCMHIRIGEAYALHAVFIPCAAIYTYLYYVMCVCVCVCVCVYITYMCMYTHVCTYIYIHTHTHTHIHIYPEHTSNGAHVTSLRSVSTTACAKPGGVPREMPSSLAP